MKIKNKSITNKNIKKILFVINNSYNELFFLKLINKIFYSRFLINNKVLFLYSDDNEIIGIIIYKIEHFEKFHILIIQELCVINKYKSLGYSKILLDCIFKKIEKEYVNCYLCSIVCDLRAIANKFEKYDLVFPRKKLSDENKLIVDTSKNLIKDWYMIEMDKKNGIFYIPFYMSIDTYNVYKTDKVSLNKKQKKLKNILTNNNYSLGFGIGIFNIIKIC